MPSVVEPARPEDDAAIQALLATRPMSGWMQLIATTQPSFFQALAWEGIRADAFVARQANQVVGLCSRVVQSFYFQGTPCQLGYLGHLRTHPQLKGQIKPIQAGFQACFQAHTATEQAFDITSILSENREARRLLEANLPGLPVYRPLREWTTLIFSVRHLTRLPSKAVALLPDQVEAYRHVLKEHFRSFGLASSWSHHLERGICPPLEQSCWLGCPNQIEATAALWDISAVKQTRVVGYRCGIAWTRPLLNGVLRLLGQPLLPKPGQALRMGYICQWSVQDEHGE
ncbi:MAG: hypothetical protein KDC71_19340 [Acidobacteria bacterium]|nr:hypothetical protein [Acidobacteriota bacterium]